MADYSRIFASSGGLLNAFSSPSNIINFTTTLAEKSAMELYMKSYKLSPNLKTIPSGIDFLFGDNLVSDLLRGGYQPHIGAYIAHKVGTATFTALKGAFDTFAPDMSRSFSDRYKQFNKTKIDDKLLSRLDDEKDFNTKLVLSAFETLDKQHPKEFQRVFFEKFNSAYMTGDRFFCVLVDETKQDFQNATETNAAIERRRTGSDTPYHNKHYLTFLVKNVTLPAADTESIEHTRFNQKFSIMGNTGFNESINVNYYVDYHNIMHKKLYTQIESNSFQSDISKYFTMYIIVNNPYQSMPEKFEQYNLDTGESNIFKSLATFGKIPNLRNNIVSVHKFNNVHVKNINQITYDNSTSDFLNMPVTFNHNGCDIEYFSMDWEQDNQYNNKQTAFKFNFLDIK